MYILFYNFEFSKILLQENSVYKYVKKSFFNQKESLHLKFA